MARARKVHVQLSLLTKLDKNGQRRGGKRTGAGRPKKGARASERHERREVFKGRHPSHVTIRVASDVASLRGFEAYKAIREAMVSTYARQLIRIIHISIQGTHVHLLVESNSRLALARGMQGFEIAAAKNINKAMSKRTGKKRRGTVFPDRYHAVIIRSPRQARNNLAYVLNNWRRHGESKLPMAKGWRVDPFSSAPSFDGFRDIDAPSLAWPDTYRPLPVYEPRSWLLSTGWRRHGLVLSTEVPGPLSSPPKRTVLARR
jgi:REP element-mobilizing transposase RayT